MCRVERAADGGLPGRENPLPSLYVKYIALCAGVPQILGSLNPIVWGTAAAAFGMKEGSNITGTPSPPPPTQPPPPPPPTPPPQIRLAHGQSAHGPRIKETNRLLLRPVQVKTLTRWRVDIGKGRHHVADL